MEFLYSHSYIVLGLSFVLIALILIVLVFITAAQSDNQENDNQPVITYNQNGYKSSLSGYQTGKYTKNNTYNGR